MVGIGYATRIYLAVEATDMRKSFEGLSGLVRERLREDPLSGHLFLFCNRPRTRLKVLYWDGNGLWVCAKRLEGGRFSWPVTSGMLNASQKRTNRAAFTDALMSRVPASTDGWLATMPIDRPSSRANPTTMFLA